MLRRTSLFLLPAVLAGCLVAQAGDDVPPAAAPAPAPVAPDTATLDALDAAVANVDKAARAVVAGVADGSIDLKTQGPAIVMAFTRLSLGQTRLEALLEKVKPTEAAPEVVAEAPEAAKPPEDPKAAEKAEKMEKTEKAPKDAAVAKTEADVKTPTETRTEAPASTAKVESEKTGIASIDSFLKHVAEVSADLEANKTKLASARGKLTNALGLAKKFKPADAQKALTDKLGTGYKIALSPSVKVTPGADAKDPAIVNDLKSAFTDLQDVSKKLPAITTKAADVGKEAADVPKKAKGELEAMGPLKAAEALGKVSKGAKTVSKVPKDAKDLSDEVALWTKIAGG